MELILIELASKYPVLLTVFAVVGVFRIVFKPLMAFLRTFVQATPSAKDDELLDKFEQGKIGKAMYFVVDYLLSIKLPGAK